jgi:hypothetical protein
MAAMFALPAFADVSPEFRNAVGGVKDDSPIQLAQANPPAVGSLDDYLHQGNDGPSTAVPPQPYQQYQPKAAPAQGIYPQAAPPQWSYREADPNAERSALIGAAVVGAVAVGIWAWQQHEARQAQHRVRKRYYLHRRAYN